VPSSQVAQRFGSMTQGVARETVPTVSSGPASSSGPAGGTSAARDGAVRGARESSNWPAGGVGESRDGAEAHDARESRGGPAGDASAVAMQQSLETMQQQGASDSSAACSWCGGGTMQPDSTAPRRAVCVFATAVVVISGIAILCMVWVRHCLSAAQNTCAPHSGALWISIAEQSSVADVAGLYTSGSESVRYCSVGGSNEVAIVGCSSLGVANMCVVDRLGYQRSRYCAAVQFLNRQHREERWKLVSSSAPLLASCGKAVVVLW
jgi:hypothetical protein